MQALITYHGGKSYWYGKQRFKLDKPVLVSDPAAIEHCRTTAGFSVEVEVEAEPEKPAPEKKKVREVVKTKKSGSA